MATTKDIGNRGEHIASVFLRANGFMIIEQNWKTRWCEIDIVATKNSCVYFIEVKYRASDTFGDGLAYITPKKVQQMNFAAQMWIHNKQYDGDCQLSAIAVDAMGSVAQFIQDL